jgi:hypothetical protein
VTWRDIGAGGTVAREAVEAREDLGQVLQALDEKSRAILWFLWWHGHADISELRGVIDAADDFEILDRLKEVINGNARKLWGRPIVGFDQSRTDPLTGEKVLFSWWFLGKENICGPCGPLVDVFNEKDSVTVIAEIPTSVDLDQMDVRFRHGILKVRLPKGSKIP